MALNLQAFRSTRSSFEAQGQQVRDRLKHVIERTAVRSGIVDRMVHSRAGHRLILAYHNVVPGDGPDWGERPLHLRADRFREHLQVLHGTCAVVGLGALCQERDADSDPLQVAITFDDGYAGAVTLGLAELTNFGMPATYFVNPGLLSDNGFWWDHVAEHFGGSIPEPVRTRCLVDMRGQQGEILEWAHSQGMSLDDTPHFARPASKQQLMALAGSSGIGIESHTWSHPNLVALPTEERTEEFTASSGWIRQLTGASPRLVSYPYGLSSDEVADDARRHGFHWGLRVSGGWLTADNLAEPLALPRLNVPAGLTAEGLRLRLAGLGMDRP